MATQEVIDALTEVARDCLTTKIQQGFAANTALTLDIAREIAQAMEERVNSYTDVRIDEVISELNANEVDLGPLYAFINEIYTLLDGDPLTEGFQIFTVLQEDATYVTNELIVHGSTLSSIQESLSTFQNTLDDHAQRIAALEAAQHDPIDCEECHDGILGLVDGSMDAACIASDAALATYRTNTAASILAAFQVEMSGEDLSPVTDWPTMIAQHWPLGAPTYGDNPAIMWEVGTGDPRIAEVRFLENNSSLPEGSDVNYAGFLPEGTPERYAANNQPAGQRAFHLPSYQSGNGMLLIGIHAYFFNSNGTLIGQRLNALDVYADGFDETGEAVMY